jgi:hypothetical protein
MSNGQQHQYDASNALDKATITAGKATLYALAECVREEHPTATEVLLSESDQGDWLMVNVVGTPEDDDLSLDDDNGNTSCLYTDVYLLRELYSQYDMRGQIEYSERMGITSFRMDVEKVLDELAPTPVGDWPLKKDLREPIPEGQRRVIVALNVPADWDLHEIATGIEGVWKGGDPTVWELPDFIADYNDTKE